MNSSTQYILNIFIDCSIITLSSMNICISTGIFLFIIHHLIKVKKSLHQVAFLLTANMYLALLFSAISILEQYIYVISKHLNYLSMIFYNGITCQFCAYLQWVSVCAIFYSNSLQAIYRLCRVVFYMKQSLQYFQLYRILIIVQWIICFVIMIPALLLGDFKYSIDDNLCSNELTIFRSAILNTGLAYFIPVSVTIGCYTYTLMKMRRGNTIMTQIQRISARRDLIVLFRICILLGLLLTIWIPITIAFFIFISTGYKPWWSGQVQRFVYHLSTASASVILALISPHVWNLLRRNIHHHHATVLPANVRMN